MAIPMAVRADQVQADDILIFNDSAHSIRVSHVSSNSFGWVRFHANNDTWTGCWKPHEIVKIARVNLTLRVK